MSAAQTRRNLLATSAAAGAALGFLADPNVAYAIAADGPEAIRPFRVSVPQETLADLRRRILATRFADRELVQDQSQGVQQTTIEEVARYWANDYDLSRLERRLNAFPQFMTEIDGVDIHFIHVRSRHRNAMPLVMTHGWPGSLVELLNSIGPLTNPTAYGGSASDAFHLVLPHMPGYGYSARPTATGWHSGRIARAWDTLMTRLGYARYVAQGGDWGARICEAMAHQAPPGLAGVHTNLLLTLPPEIVRGVAISEAPPGLTETERAAFDQVRARTRGYFIEQATRPQTIAGSLADSPIGLAAWMMDHDPNSYAKFASAFAGQPVGGLTRDEFLDDVMLYWVTNTAASSARLYWEEARTSYTGTVSVPAGFTVFPGESFRAPRTWVERTFANLIYYNEVDRGGHFAAWEEPQLFAQEVSAAFRPLRRAV